MGSIDGTYFKITGTGFVGPKVTLGGIVVSGRTYSPGPETILVTAPAHAAGSLDVVVTNLDGKTATVVRGFTYAPPASFDVNGDWEGGADSNYETLLRFTIHDNALISVACGTSALVIFSSPLPIAGGEFSFVGDDGTSISGRILSPDSAIGAISLPSCVAYPWFATKQR